MKQELSFPLPLHGKALLLSSLARVCETSTGRECCASNDQAVAAIGASVRAYGGQVCDNVRLAALSTYLCECDVALGWVVTDGWYTPPVVASFTPSSGSAADGKS